MVSAMSAASLRISSFIPVISAALRVNTKVRDHNYGSYSHSNPLASFHYKYGY